MQDARLFFSQARDAMQVICAYDTEITYEKALAGIRARSYEPRITMTINSDPMHHINKAVDMEASRSSILKSSYVELGKALTIVDNIKALLGSSYANVLLYRYLLCYKWEDLARELGVTKTYATKLCEIALDYCDSEGLARIYECKPIWTSAEV